MPTRKVLHMRISTVFIKGGNSSSDVRLSLMNLNIVAFMLYSWGCEKR